MNISNYLYGRMEKGLKTIISKDVNTEKGACSPIKKDEDALLTFAVWGDPQISFISPLRSARVYRAVNDLKNADSLDALVLCGDVTEYGAKCEYKFVKRLLDEVGGGVQRIFAVTGNHDVRLRYHKKQMKRFQNFISSLNKGDTDFSDSYYYTNLLSFPQYTRPEVFRGMPVPPVLLSGNHAEIRRWRHEQQLKKTRERRPDLLLKDIQQ